MITRAAIQPVGVRIKVYRVIQVRAMQPVRLTRRRIQADEWALVLASAQIPHRVAREGPGWALLVSDDDAPGAHAALAAYDEETRLERDAAIPEGASFSLASAIGVAVGALLLAFFAVTGPPVAGSPWFERGAASSSDIVSGEYWRAVTALTLHVDAYHVVGNAVATTVLLSAVVQRLGPGCGLTLVLLAGTLANLVGALAHGPRYVAVGASTATFGAVGILAALRLFPASLAVKTRWRPWVVLVASVVLLAILGTGRGADVLGHALGLLAGGGLSLATGAALKRPLAAAVQWLLVVAATLAIVGCWRLALSGPGS